MKVVKGLDDIKALVGQEIGTSDWVVIEQSRINDFADATLDHQWIHIDEEKAKASPLRTTIAHGFLTLSLLPYLTSQIWKVEGARMGLNYGLDKVRFPEMVPVGSKVRARATLTSADDISGNGVHLKTTVTIEREGGNKPVCVAESLSRIYF